VRGTALKQNIARRLSETSLRLALVVSLALPTLTALLIGTVLLFALSRNALEEELGRSLSMQAAVIASQLKAERVAALKAEDSIGEPTRLQRSLMAQLHDAQSATGLRRIFVFDLQRRVKLDSAAQLPFGEEAPELMRDNYELDKVFLGQPTASQVLFEGADLKLYKTGYAPMWFNGQVVGAVAVEGSVAFFGPLQALRRGFGLLALATALTLLLAIAISVRLLAAPLRRLVDSAKRMSIGDLTTPVRPEATHELGILSRSFEGARIALERREREQKMMLGGVAHEIRNPLGGISLFAGLLREELKAAAQPSVDAAAHVEKILGETHRLTALVDEFLKYAKDQAPQRTSIDAKALVESVVARVFVGEHAGAERIVGEVDSAMLSVDESMISTALINLLKNAVQATPGEERVLIKGTLQQSGYVFEVKNVGVPIPLERQSQIFDLFYTTKQQGTGLGLPLTRKFVEAHGGSISVRSAAQQTVFTVFLDRRSLSTAE
jgi:signal transduction histidine kinase